MATTKQARKPAKARSATKPRKPAKRKAANKQPTVRELKASAKKVRADIAKLERQLRAIQIILDARELKAKTLKVRRRTRPTPKPITVPRGGKVNGYGGGLRH